MLPAVFLMTVPLANVNGADDVWWRQDNAGEHQVYLYFFWTETCPHCRDAQPFVAALAVQTSWLEVKAFALHERPAHGRRYAELAHEAGEVPRSVPAFLFCGRMVTGFDSPQGIGREVRRGLEACKAILAEGGDPLVAASSEPSAARLPVLGEVDLRTWSLPAVAITLGLLDSFNPCAFFVLLFLLSVLVNARSRSRMLLVGGVFVSISGLVYFLFMAAWLNLFLLVGQIMWVSALAGCVAVLIGVLNVKDFFLPGEGPSLSIPAGARPGLFRRMRAIVGARSLTAVLAGTLVLAVVANAYELLCTAGFPMVFTRMLTLHALPPLSYYGYIGLYCVVYLVPLLTIVAVFVWTMGRRKLTDAEGRLLKLVSGLMMLALGMLLLIAPDLLTRPLVSIAIVLVVCAVAFVVHRFAGSARMT